MSDPAPVLALHVGGRKLDAAIVQADGSLLAFRSLPAQAGDAPEAVVDRLGNIGRAVAAEANLELGSIPMVGVTCRPGWDDVPLRAMVTDAFDLPVVVEEDETAAVLAETRWGARGEGLGGVLGAAAIAFD